MCHLIYILIVCRAFEELVRFRLGNLPFANKNDSPNDEERHRQLFCFSKGTTSRVCNYSNLLLAFLLFFAKNYFYIQ